MFSISLSSSAFHYGRRSELCAIDVETKKKEADPKWKGGMCDKAQ